MQRGLITVSLRLQDLLRFEFFQILCSPFSSYHTGSLIS
nr:MAG TPA: hypothetical protein [Caudoviricetes sp.]